MRGKHNKRVNINPIENEAQEELATVIPIEKGRQEIFPDLKKFKYLKAKSGAYALTLYFRSLLLEESLIYEDDLEKRQAIQTVSDFTFDHWLAYKKMFGFTDKFSEEFMVPWGRVILSESHFKDLYESRWNSDKSIVKMIKRIYSGLQTKQEMLEQYGKTDPQLDVFLSTVESAVKVKRTADVLQNKENEDGIPDIQEVMKQIKEQIRKVALQTEICLVNPESKNLKPPVDHIAGLMFSSRNTILSMENEVKKFEEEMQFGKEAASELDPVIPEIIAKETDTKLQLVKSVEKKTE